MLARRNVHELPGAKDRSKGELIELGGTGLVVVGRPPLFATVRFDERDTAPAFPLAPGTAISQQFSQFYLFHPFVEAGTFRLILLQGADWVEQPFEPERLGYSGFWTLPSAVGKKWCIQLYNNAKAVSSLGTTRLVRVHRITIASLAGATRYELAKLQANETPALAKLQTPVVTDGRLVEDGTGNSIGQAEVQGSADLGVTPFGTPFHVEAFDSARQPTLSIDVNIVLSPGQALRVQQPDTTVAMASPYVSFDYSEEPFN